MSEVVPELLLECVYVLLGELEELAGSDLLLLVEVAPQLQLVLDLRNRVVDVLVDTLHPRDFLTGDVLQHLQLVFLVVLEAVCAQVHSALQALVHVDELVVGTEVANFGLIHNLSGKTVLNNGAGLTQISVGNAVNGSQELVLIHVWELV